MATLHTIRLAVWGKPEDIAKLEKGGGSGDRIQADNTEDALKAFGLIME